MSDVPLNPVVQPSSEQNAAIDETLTGDTPPDREIGEEEAAPVEAQVNWLGKHKDQIVAFKWNGNTWESLILDQDQPLKPRQRKLLFVAARVGLSRYMRRLNFKHATAVRLKNIEAQKAVAAALEESRRKGAI